MITVTFHDKEDNVVDTLTTMAAVNTAFALPATTTERAFLKKITDYFDFKYKGVDYQLGTFNLNNTNDTISVKFNEA